MLCDYEGKCSINILATNRRKTSLNGFVSSRKYSSGLLRNVPLPTNPCTLISLPSRLHWHMFLSLQHKFTFRVHLGQSQEIRLKWDGYDERNVFFCSIIASSFMAPFLSTLMTRCRLSCAAGADAASTLTWKIVVRTSPRKMLIVMTWAQPLNWNLIKQMSSRYNKLFLFKTSSNDSLIAISFANSHVCKFALIKAC